MLEEITQTDIPMPRSGRWTNAGVVRSKRICAAWRVLDAQYNICSDKSNSMLSDNPYSGIYETDVTRTLDGNGGNPACNQGGTVIVQELIDWIVRRLTPRECERLQGYPDDWTVLPKIKDMSEADYLFFRDVFCTYRAINGKPVKRLPTKEQIIKWYNKLDK